MRIGEYVTISREVCVNISKVISKNKLKEGVLKILIASFGVIITTIGIYFFLIPADLAAGGLAGFAMVIGEWFPWIQISSIMFIGNAVLMALGFLLVGKEFGALTIFCTYFLTFVMYLFELFFPLKGPIVDDLFLNLVYGIIISGAGLGIVFYQNASTGGTDILAKIINKYTRLEMGKALFASDIVIVILACIAFDLRVGLYSLLGIVMNAVVVDSVIGGFTRKISVMIHTTEVEAINNFILNEMERGTTLYSAEGGYSGKPKKIINTVVTAREYARIRSFAKAADKHVFISSHFAGEVHGEGFTYTSPDSDV